MKFETIEVLLRLSNVLLVCRHEGVMTVRRHWTPSSVVMCRLLTSASYAARLLVVWKCSRIM
jgi:hypothetical protein